MYNRRFERAVSSADRLLDFSTLNTRLALHSVAKSGFGQNGRVRVRCAEFNPSEVGRRDQGDQFTAISQAIYLRLADSGAWQRAG